MDFLTDLFQNNPVVVLITAVISLLGGVITIVAHWKPFCRDVLLKKITLPAYAYLITCLLYTSPSPRDRTRSRMPSSA